MARHYKSNSFYAVKNPAAGATIGSNHNSRGADGELIAGRGFWPGLCVSLKHNSVFASFCLLAKGDYPAELRIELPFSLISNDVKNDKLVIMPAYWFQYNMYALARNSWKYIARDQRTEKTQLIEYDYLAPDTANEMFKGISILEKISGAAWFRKAGKTASENSTMKKGKEILLNKSEIPEDFEFLLPDAENSQRPVIVKNAAIAYQSYIDLLKYYVAREIVAFFIRKPLSSFNRMAAKLPLAGKIADWENIGGQLIEKAALTDCLQQIKKGKLIGWDAVHQFYRDQALKYPDQKLSHSISIYKSITGIDLSNNKAELMSLLLWSIDFRKDVADRIKESRAKDYYNPFRQMVYNDKEEMETVIGSLEENGFINQEKKEFLHYKKQVTELLNK